LIKSEAQWLKEGCENCPQLDIQGDIDRMIDCTTVGYDGMIALTTPGKSWMGRWNKLEGAVAGCYAVEVDGEIPDESSAASSEGEDEED
jgi:transcription elongation factor SPT4